MMSISRHQLSNYLNSLLSVSAIKDYCPNGVQVEGVSEIRRIITGVTASEALIDAAIERNADAILVHHGYFWKGEASAITGLKRNRLKKLLTHDINLFAYHLPVDVHAELGNNAQLAARLGIKDVKSIDSVAPVGVLMQGVLEPSLDAVSLEQLLKNKLHRQPLVNSVRERPIETIAWCTGGGQSYIDVAAELGVDAFLTGEVSEQTIHSSREYGVDFFAAGHHATERYGIQSLGEHIARQFNIEVEFVDIDNPA